MTRWELQWLELQLSTHQGHWGWPFCFSLGHVGYSSFFIFQRKERANMTRLGLNDEKTWHVVVPRWWGWWCNGKGFKGLGKCKINNRKSKRGCWWRRSRHKMEQGWKKRGKNSWFWQSQALSAFFREGDRGCYVCVCVWRCGGTRGCGEKRVSWERTVTIVGFGLG